MHVTNYGPNMKASLTYLKKDNGQPSLQKKGTAVISAGDWLGIAGTEKFKLAPYAQQRDLLVTQAQNQQVYKHTHQIRGFQTRPSYTSDIRDTIPGCHHWQRQIAAFWQSYLETSQLLCQRPFESADDFLRKYPNQWSDKNFELAKRVARMAKQNVQTLRRDASIQCQNYFEQRSIESRYEEPSSTDMESPSNSILDFADNAILARNDQEAPAQDCYHS